MKKASDNHWKAGSMGHKTGLGTVKKGKIIPAPLGKQNSRFLDRPARSFFLVLRCQIKLCERFYFRRRKLNITPVTTARMLVLGIRNTFNTWYACTTPIPN
jgi:hypothetical protein